MKSKKITEYRFAKLDGPPEPGELIIRPEKEIDTWSTIKVAQVNEDGKGGIKQILSGHILHSTSELYKNSVGTVTLFNWTKCYTRILCVKKIAVGLVMKTGGIEVIKTYDFSVRNKRKADKFARNKYKKGYNSRVTIYWEEMKNENTSGTEIGKEILGQRRQEDFSYKEIKTIFQKLSQGWAKRKAKTKENNKDQSEKPSPDKKGTRTKSQE